MLISTRGRYALRVMIDLAQHNDGTLIALRDVAARQEISEKYLESIIVVLSKAGFVQASRGKGGGYRLACGPEEYTVASIVELTEGSLAPISCLEGAENTCPRRDACKTLPMWSQLGRVITKYLEGISLRDLAEGKLPPDPVWQ